MAEETEIIKIEIDYFAGGICKETLENKNDLVLRVSGRETRHKSCLSLTRELRRALVPGTSRVYDVSITGNAREAIYPYAGRIIRNLTSAVNILSNKYVSTSMKTWKDTSKQLLIDLANYF